MPREIEPTEGRQGFTGHGVSYVLALSLAGIVVVFAILYVLFALQDRLTRPSSRRRP